MTLNNQISKEEDESKNKPQSQDTDTNNGSNGGDAKTGTENNENSALGYQHTLMYGSYTSDLGRYAKDASRKLRKDSTVDLKRKREEIFRKKGLKVRYTKSRFGKAFSRGFNYVWQKSFARLGEDWVFLAILGVLMAIISFLMDWGISICNRARIYLFIDFNYNVTVQYFSWIILPVCLVLFSSGLVQIIGPSAIGSGIPEMKTILRGVTLKEYLTFKTLFAKVIGLTASLGSGMPLGKEGPFVHIASIVASLLTKLQAFRKIYENETKSHEFLQAACAVGVACCFAAPVGGVLFSIEVTAVYFAVRDYWRGFFAAAIGSMFFRLLAVFFQGLDTIKPVFKTYLGSEFPYDPQELIIFSIIGVVSGLVGALFVLCHRKYVLWMRGNKRLNSFLQKNRFIYPFIVSILIASLNFPIGFGQFIAGELTTHDQVVTLFSNFTWTKTNFTVEEISIVKYWVNPYTGIFVNLFLFVVFTFLLSILAATLPVPSGNFVPVFKLGAGLGRLIGEAMHLWFPYGINFSGDSWPIIPGGYAVVGAAAVSGAVTRTISICVIISEMTGQITHIIPIMIAVLISNAVAGLLQPSLFDSISMIKKLPYLPDFIPSSSLGAYDIIVRDFMIREVKYIWYGMSYKELKDILKENTNLSSFPLVDKPEEDSMILLGSIPRHSLIRIIEKHIGRERRIQAAAKWHREAMEKKEQQERQKLTQMRRPSRFEVVPVIISSQIPGITISTADSASNDSIPIKKEFSGGSGRLLSPNLNGRPKKSILKKTNSFSLIRLNSNSPYATLHSINTGAESRLRSAFHTIFQKSATLQDANAETGKLLSNSANGLSSEDATEEQPPRIKKTKTVQLPIERIIDMSVEEQKSWEEMEMKLPVDFTLINIDASPFQLVAKTTLLKVHSLFSMLGINHAYVTATGRLIGVVGMRELRKAIEECNSGTFRSSSASEDSTSTDNLSPSDDVNEESKDELYSLDSALDTDPETDEDNQRLK